MVGCRRLPSAGTTATGTTAGTAITITTIGITMMTMISPRASCGASASGVLGNMIYDMGYKSYRNPYPAPPVQYKRLEVHDQLHRARFSDRRRQSAGRRSGDPTRRNQVRRGARALPRRLQAGRLRRRLQGGGRGDRLHSRAMSRCTNTARWCSSPSASMRTPPACSTPCSPPAPAGAGTRWSGSTTRSATYNDQLRKLEAYVKGKPDGAEARFLLGYHYMVCGHMDKPMNNSTKPANCNRPTPSPANSAI